MADSIADRFITTMALIRDLERYTSNNAEPMRHQVRTLKMHAERVLDDAIRSAWSIADTANRLPRDSQEIVTDALKKDAAP